MHVLPYHPKTNHPWRRYKDKMEGEDPEKVIEPSQLKVLLSDIVENWDTYDLGTTDQFAIGKLKYMSDLQISLWLTDILKRKFISAIYSLEEDEE